MTGSDTIGYIIKHSKHQMIHTTVKKTFYMLKYLLIFVASVQSKSYYLNKLIWKIWKKIKLLCSKRSKWWPWWLHIHSKFICLLKNLIFAFSFQILLDFIPDLLRFTSNQCTTRILGWFNSSRIICCILIEIFDCIECIMVNNISSFYLGFR